MRVFTGKVISIKNEKTAAVAVERIVSHPVYIKRYKRTKKYHVHDTIGTKVGDTVNFVASRPFSKLKRWKIIEVINTENMKVKKGKRNKRGSKK